MLWVQTILGKLHEVCVYGIISAIICFFGGKITLQSLMVAGFHVSSFRTFYMAFMFWSSIIFLPISIMGAFATKYLDRGEGLTFKSDHIVVIMCAHVGEELLGLVQTPFWFLKDLFTKRLHKGWQIFDYISYAVLVIFAIVGIVFVWN